jgi:SAM-dependent methyltransferase
MSRLARICRWTRERGPLWTLLWVLRRAVCAGQRWLLGRLDLRLAAIERQRFVLGSDTVSSLGNTVAENREVWNDWDWSQLGEEWTEDAADFRGLDPQAWKQEIIERFLLAHACKGGPTLEIGPGAGRWTESLLEVSGSLHLADISARCLEVCQQRFGSAHELATHLVEAGSLDFLDDGSVDFIWSYDVFVHVNPMDTDAYLAEFARVLRPGAKAVIHHADRYTSHVERAVGFRSNLSRAFFSELCKRHGLRVIEQDRDHAHKRGDCISVVARPER